MAYKIPDAMKVKNLGAGWGGESPRKMKNTVMKQFQKQSGVPKAMNNKTKKLDKSARTNGF